MHGTSKYKIPEGKLVEIRVDYETAIKKIEILGDFFIYPEEAISQIEKSLIGIKIDEDEKSIAEKVRKVADANKVEMIGVNPEAIAKAVKMAVKA